MHLYRLHLGWKKGIRRRRTGSCAAAALRTANQAVVRRYIRATCYTCARTEILCTLCTSPLRAANRNAKQSAGAQAHKRRQRSAPATRSLHSVSTLSRMKDKNYSSKLGGLRPTRSNILLRPCSPSALSAGGVAAPPVPRHTPALGRPLAAQQAFGSSAATRTPSPLGACTRPTAAGTAPPRPPPRPEPKRATRRRRGAARPLSNSWSFRDFAGRGTKIARTGGSAAGSG
jgi:hypothetical protein